MLHWKMVYVAWCSFFRKMHSEGSLARFRHPAIVFAAILGVSWVYSQEVYAQDTEANKDQTDSGKTDSGKTDSDEDEDEETNTGSENEEIGHADESDFFSAKHLEFLSFGIELDLGVGYGSVLATGFDNDDFWYHGGTGGQIGFGIVLSSGRTFGVKWASTSLGASDNSAFTDGDATSSALSAYYRGYLSSLSSPLWAWFRLDIGTVDVSGRWQQYDRPEFSGGNKFVMSGYSLGWTLGFDYAFFDSLPGLRFGVSAGVEFWASMSDQEETDIDIPFPDFGDSDAMLSQAILRYNVMANMRFVVPLFDQAPPPAEYLLVETKRSFSSSERAKADVSAAVLYQAVLPKLKRVALSAPSNCINRTAAESTGGARSSTAVLTMVCGVEMGEMERALSGAGYQVASWRAVSALVAQQVTPTEAARQLGAQVLFQVNSLENTSTDPVINSRRERKFYQSNAHGIRGVPYAMTKSESAHLAPYFASREKLATVGGQRQGAMLDINAVDVETGQTFWFYRWEKLDTAIESGSEQTLYVRQNGKPWLPVAPEEDRVEKAVVEETTSTGDVVDDTTGGTAASAVTAKNFLLVREVVENFVREFTGTVSVNQN